MGLQDLTPQHRATLTRLATDLPFFAAKCLKIVDKVGQIVPLVFSRAQRHIHESIEEQKQRTGRVRAVLLKGRQIYGTTYVQARFFHQTNFQSNLSAFVLSHQAASTISIFSMTQVFRKHLPEDLQMPLTKDTEKAMTMDNGSKYSVGTAGSAEIGRSMTVQRLHSSEGAFYENADQLSTGLMQTVADLPSTEVIFESTANGPSGFFYDLVMGAIAGTNGYELIFVPWYWCEDYKASTALLETDLADDERKYYKLYKDNGLTLYHLTWRRTKIGSLGGKTWKFQQEYPFTPEEAFVKAEGRFFNLPNIYEAKAREVAEDETLPLIIGVDQGRTGDGTEISRRRGRKLFDFETIAGDDGNERDMRLAGRLSRIIDRENPDLVVIDTTNEHGALDRLHELGYSKRLVRGVHFGEKADDPKRYRNKRTEMHFDFREWIDNTEPSIPDNQMFITEIGAIPEEKETSNCVKYLVSKDDIKKDLKRSPDKLDATVLTFAYRVKKRKTPSSGSGKGQRSLVAAHTSSLKSLSGLGQRR